MVDEYGFNMIRDTTVNGISDYVSRASRVKARPFNTTKVATKEVLEYLASVHDIKISSHVLHAALTRCGWVDCGNVQTISGTTRVWSIDGMGAEGGLSKAVADGMASYDGVFRHDAVSVPEVVEWALERGLSGVSNITVSRALTAAGARKVGQIYDVGLRIKPVCYLVRNFDHYNVGGMELVRSMYNTQRGRMKKGEM